MEAIIYDSGDSSVGIFPTAFTVGCPMDINADSEEKEFFRKGLFNLYSEFAQGKLKVVFDYEIEAEYAELTKNDPDA